LKLQLFELQILIIEKEISTLAKTKTKSHENKENLTSAMETYEKINKPRE
jgi:hypothetical protein